MGEIGVISTSDNMAKILLVFLRMYIDDDYGYIFYILSDHMDNLFNESRINNYSNDIISYHNPIKNYELLLNLIILMDFPYSNWYDINNGLNNIIDYKLNNVRITVYYDDVDKYNFDRLYKCFEKL